MNERSRSENAQWRAMLPSRRRLVRLLPSLMLCIGLLLVLCACTRSIVVIPDAPDCSRYVPESLWQPTPGAPLPQTPAAGEWAQFANGQTGRLEEANLKPPAIRHIVTTCEQLHAKAVAKAERQSKPWWRRGL